VDKEFEDNQPLHLTGTARPRFYLTGLANRSHGVNVVKTGVPLALPRSLAIKETSMCRFAIFAPLLVALFQVSPGAADDRKDKKAELKKAIANADVILVGKVTKTGLVAASSFDVGLIEATRVLKGDKKIKSVQFRFSGRVAPPYAKVGVEGVWVLSKADNKPGWRSVLSFQPLTEEKTVKALIKEVKKKEKAKKDR
jgi:hypothetical protein